jgi:hypothetical protein
VDSGGVCICIGAASFVTTRGFVKTLRGGGEILAASEWAVAGTLCRPHMACRIMLPRAFSARRVLYPCDIDSTSGA